MGTLKNIPITVTYTRGKGKKVYKTTFTNLRCVDDLLKENTKLLPFNASIKEVGMGKNFKNKYKN